MIPYAREAGALVLVGLLAAGGWSLYRQGGKSARIELAEYKTKVARDAAKVAELARDAANKARSAERNKANELARIGQQYEDDKRESTQAAYDRALADVRSGRVRLRGPWADPVPGPAASPGERDAAAQRRAEAAARVIRIGAEADAQLRACQAVIAADRTP